MSFPPRPAAPTVARHVPTLTEVIEVKPQSLPEPVVDLALPEPALEPAVSAGSGRAGVERLAVPDLVLADPDTPPLADAVLVSAATASTDGIAAPVLTEQDRAVLPRAVLRPSALTSAFVPSTAPLAAPTAAAPPALAASQPSPWTVDPSARAIDEAQIVQRVHADLQRQIDGMLEYRLREAMAPVLARTTELLVRELRQELSKTMKDVVARAVAQEVARQRSRQGQ